MSRGVLRDDMVAADVENARQSRRKASVRAAQERKASRMSRRVRRQCSEGTPQLTHVETEPDAWQMVRRRCSEAALQGAYAAQEPKASQITVGVQQQRSTVTPPSTQGEAAPEAWQTVRRRCSEAALQAAYAGKQGKSSRIALRKGSDLMFRSAYVQALQGRRSGEGTTQHRLKGWLGARRQGSSAAQRSEAGKLTTWLRALKERITRPAVRPRPAAGSLARLPSRSPAACAASSGRFDTCIVPVDHPTMTARI